MHILHGNHEILPFAVGKLAALNHTQVLNDDARGGASQMPSVWRESQAGQPPAGFYRFSSEASLHERMDCLRGAVTPVRNVVSDVSPESIAYF
ncbi:hypothetical protein [Paraburkholderia bryophila]|uniref:Uncharacterized protein n=1 Tax=Paraburkholderia bryophila TaxID=420952 RepID=A0A7Z0B588_9BURK|nr:hypothetical protein [Paraburkholderia bryophila]NYH20152.1 hypothetical protein [Paraburkholderia bryophila]NYH20824.1 hypothetical protein [Paraburkholderia bryophila]